jgi:hypothetical protein
MPTAAPARRHDVDQNAGLATRCRAASSHCRRDSTGMRGGAGPGDGSCDLARSCEPSASFAPASAVSSNHTESQHPCPSEAQQSPCPSRRASVGHRSDPHVVQVLGLRPNRPHQPTGRGYASSAYDEAGPFTGHLARVNKVNNGVPRQARRAGQRPYDDVTRWFPSWCPCGADPERTHKSRLPPDDTSVMKLHLRRHRTASGVPACSAASTFGTKRSRCRIGMYVGRADAARNPVIA